MEEYIVLACSKEMRAVDAWETEVLFWSAWPWSYVDVGLERIDCKILPVAIHAGAAGHSKLP